MQLKPVSAAQPSGQILPKAKEETDHSKKSTLDQEKITQDKELKKTPSKIKNCLKFTTRCLGIEPLRWLGYATFTAIALIFTTEGNLTVNRLAQALKYVPKPNKVTNANPEINGYSIDAFFKNQDGFPYIEKAIRELNLNIKEFDTNKDGIALSTRQERQKLREEFINSKQTTTNQEIKNNIDLALKHLNTIDVLDQIVFGINGIDPEKYSQGGLQNCEILAAIKGLSFTPEYIQELKSMIKITDYSLEKKQFLNIDVNIDGRKIPVPFTKLSQWMSPRDFDASRATDGSLAFSILAYASEEAGNKYDRVPHMLQSTSPILLTGKDYVTVLTWSLDDDDLRHILSQAPQKLITVGSYIRKEDFTLATLSRELQNKYYRLPPAISDEKVERFQELIKQKIEEIITRQIEPTQKNQSESSSLPKALNPLPLQKATVTRPVHPIKTPSSQEVTKRNNPQRELSGIIPHHQYTVKSYTHIGDEDIIILTDSHGTEYKSLNISEFREYTSVVVLPNDDLPPINKRSLLPAILTLIGLLVTRKSANKLNKFLNPEYKNWLVRTSGYGPEKLQKVIKSIS
ncbi:MAG: hypothetical protein HY094_07175 [Candidatus Melainabacteria bacterium]|nr:hypothetical protein [Candidatus Melainabacteria bacterium]